VGAWQESWTAGHVPLALRPSLGPKGRLWMVGGRGVWSSSDGFTWDRATARLPWGDRYGAVIVFFRGELWALGGEEQQIKTNEVYHSPDGERWIEARQPPWSPRRWHGAAVFQDRLWLLGGTDSESRNDVWETADGANWRRVTSAAGWPPRGGHAVVVWRAQLCLIGGGESARPLLDVWCSRDGARWSEVIGRAPWSPRVFPGIAVFDGKLWVFGGSDTRASGDASWLNDVWATGDGTRWKQESAHAPWSARAPEYSVVFAGKLWIYGGKGIEARGRGGFADDVWTLRKVQ